MSSKSASQKIDFAKYRSPELFEKISALLDWKGTFGGGFLKAFLATLALLFIIAILAIGSEYLIYGFGMRLVLLGILILFTGAPFAVPGGLFYAIANLIRESLDNMLRIVDLLLETTKNIADDIRSVRSGDAKMPSPKELVQGVYTEVFLPILEQVIADQLWILGKPVLFLYRLTLGRLMRLVIRILPERTLEKLHGENLESTHQQVMKGLDTIADNETTISGALTWTQEKLKRYGSKVKQIIMFPCYIIAAMVVGLSVLFLLFDWGLMHWVSIYFLPPEEAAQKISEEIQNMRP